MNRLLLIIGSILVSQTLGLAQVPANSPALASNSLTEKVDALFAQWNKADSPGCALAVIQNGIVVYKRGYGMANLELGVPINSASVFQVGSISKQFTAFSILLLAQQGKLSLDDDIRKYIPEVPDFGVPITLRHLLQHTSGLRDQYEMLEMAGWRNEDVNTEKDVLDMVSRQRTLNHKPGEEWLYTNTGYTLLAIIVKRVSGESFRAFTEKNIFRPLGMTNTQFNDDHHRITKSLAQGYASKDGGFIKWMANDDHVGADNLLTTVEDLARWDQNFYDKKIGGPALIDQMLTIGSLNNGDKVTYAYGLFLEPYRGLPVVRHSGARLGYRSDFLRFPEQKFSVVCFCNVRSAIAEVFVNRIADIYLDDKLKPVTQGSLITTDPNIAKLADQDLARVAGYYWNPTADNIRRLYLKDGKLMFFRAAGNESELAPLGSSRFLMLGVRNRIEITFDAKRAGDRPTQMSLTVDNGKPTIYPAITPVSYGAAQLAEFAGEYYSPELDVRYQTAIEDGRLVLHAGKWGDFKLSPRLLIHFRILRNWEACCSYAIAKSAWWVSSSGPARFAICVSTRSNKPFSTRPSR